MKHICGLFSSLQCDSPYIITFFGAFFVENRISICTEFMDGKFFYFLTILVFFANLSCVGETLGNCPVCLYTVSIYTSADKESILLL